MAPLDFSCIPPADAAAAAGNPTPPPFNLCFHGSCIISPTTGQQSCACSPGYLHDFSVLHFPSCTVPVDAYYGNLVAHAVADFFMGAILLWLVFHTVSLVRLVIGSGFLLVLFFFTSSLTVYLEQG